jgi:hypothetical protein
MGKERREMDPRCVVNRAKVESSFFVKSRNYVTKRCNLATTKNDKLDTVSQCMMPLLEPKLDYVFPP